MREERWTRAGEMPEGCALVARHGRSGVPYLRALVEVSGAATRGEPLPEPCESCAHAADCWRVGGGAT